MKHENPSETSTPSAGPSPTEPGVSKAFLEWRARWQKEQAASLARLAKIEAVRQRDRNAILARPAETEALPRVEHQTSIARIKVYPPPTNTCVLCGVKVPLQRMLQHKRDKHNEQMFTESPVRKSRVSPWVKVVSGGLPSLGKRSR